MTQDLFPEMRLSLDALRALQLERLKGVLRHAYEHQAPYRAKCQATGVHPDDLRHLDDLQRFPFTAKADLRDAYPYGMLAIPREKCVRIHASSGTTGRPTVVGYSARDIDTWADLMARSLYAGGARPGDVIHNAYGYGLFTGGLGAHYGAERLGCTVVPMSGGFGERQVQLIREFGARVVLMTPSYMLAIADEFARQGVDPREHRDAGRPVRRRAMDRGHARRDRAAARHRRRRPLWPERSDGAGRGLRVRRDQGWPDDLGGSFLSGDRRSRAQASWWPTASRASWC